MQVGFLSRFCCVNWDALVSVNYAPSDYHPKYLKGTPAQLRMTADIQADEVERYARTEAQPPELCRTQRTRLSVVAIS